MNEKIYISGIFSIYLLLKVKIYEFSEMPPVKLFAIYQRLNYISTQY